MTQAQAHRPITTAALDRDAFYIDGAWAAPATGDVIEVVSPHTEQVVARVPERPSRQTSTPPSPRLAVPSTRGPGRGRRPTSGSRSCSASRTCTPRGWATWPSSSPSRWVRRRPSPTWPSRRRPGCRSRRSSPSPATSPGRRPGRECSAPTSLVRHEPVGVVAAIPPWNVPQFTLISKIVPALLAGCTVVAKPAPESPLDAYLLAELLDEAGVPPGVVNIVAGGREIGAHLVAHPGIDKVAFTGSTAAGRLIGAVCGEQLKRCSLELGGKSAAIVLDDADLGRHDGGPAVHRADELRAGLRGPDPHPGAAQPLRRGRRRARADRALDAGRRPGRPGHRGGPDGRAPPAGAGVVVHRGRPAGGRPPGGRRHRDAGRARPRLVRASRRSSPTSTTGCGSPRRRSSARSCR